MLRLPLPDLTLRQTLAERGLECHLLVADEHPERRVGLMEFPRLLCKEVESVLQSAYSLPLSPEHLRFVTWGVALTGEAGIVAFSALTFYSDFPSYFHSRFEAVHPSVQRTGLGRALYECIAVWTRHLAFADPIVQEGVLQSGGDYCVVAVIDADEQGSDCDDEPSPEVRKDDNEAGHGTFLKKLGFVRAVHDFRQDPDTEIAFQLAFHVPLLAAFTDTSESLQKGVEFELH